MGVALLVKPSDEVSRVDGVSRRDKKELPLAVEAGLLEPWASAVGDCGGCRSLWELVEAAKLCRDGAGGNGGNSRCRAIHLSKASSVLS